MATVILYSSGLQRDESSLHAVCERDPSTQACAGGQTLALNRTLMVTIQNTTNATQMVGLGAYASVSAVPEPGTAALGLGGLGIVAASVLRSSRRRAALSARAPLRRA